MTSSYDSLGIRPIINAQATLTMFGGSLMPEEVRKAMDQAAGSFVDLHQLQLSIGERLAELTHNEAAYVCLLYTSPSPRDLSTSRMPSSA